MDDIRIAFNVLHPDTAAAFAHAFRDAPNVIVDRKDICQSTADCVVTAGNSFGYMDGGVDGAVNSMLSAFDADERIDAAVRRQIAARYFGEQPVGTCLLLETKHPRVRWLAHAPTMRLPEDVGGTLNAYAAFRAALTEILLHNKRPIDYTTQPSRIRSVLTTAFCTGAGSMSAEKSARQMRAAYDSMVAPSYGYDWKQVWSAHRSLTA